MHREGHQEEDYHRSITRDKVRVKDHLNLHLRKHKTSIHSTLWRPMRSSTRPCSRGGKRGAVGVMERAEEGRRGERARGVGVREVDRGQKGMRMWKYR